MDNDFPTQMAGTRLGFDLRAGLPGGSLRDLMQMPDAQVGRLRVDQLMNFGNPMAPEKSEPLYTALGSVEPPETFGAPMMS